MPSFFLNLRRGNEELPNDHEPQEFTDLEAPRLEAIESLREIAAHAKSDGETTDHDGIDITDQSGTILLRVSMARVLGVK